jgi:hypothetical protein
VIGIITIKKHEKNLKKFKKQTWCRHIYRENSELSGSHPLGNLTVLFLSNGEGVMQALSSKNSENLL